MARITSDCCALLTILQPGSRASEVDVWHFYADLTSTSEARAGHCHAMDTLNAAVCDHASCTEVDRRFSGNLVEVTMAFITGAPLPAPFRRLGNVTGFGAGHFVLNNLGAAMTATVDRLKGRCDFWRSAGILENYAWDE